MTIITGVTSPHVFPSGKFNKQKGKRRRRRMQMPSLKPGQIAEIERPECGENRSLPIFDPKNPLAAPRIRVRRGVFEFIRAVLPGSRSKYDPVVCDQAREVRQ